MKRDNLILQAGRWMRLLTCFLVILAVAIQRDGRDCERLDQGIKSHFTTLTALAIIQDAAEQTISTMDVVSGMSPNPTIGDTMPPNTKPMAPTMAAAAPV
jgi:hypothetical protein